MSRLLDKQLDRATWAGDITKVREVLERGARINRLTDGLTPLMRAACCGHAQLASFLLAQGANPNETAPDGASALFWASARGHEAIVELLLAAGADVNAARGPDNRRERDDGASPLNMAIGHGYIGIAEKLIEAGASLDHCFLGRDIREYAERCQATEIIAILNNRRRGTRHSH